MARPKNLQGALDRQDNEFYTLYSSVEYVFNNVDGLKEYVKDKIYLVTQKRVIFISI